MKSLLAALLVGTLLLASCGDQEPPVAEQAATADMSSLMAELFEEHFERELELNLLAATSIGDYRYNDRYANSLGPERKSRRWPSQDGIVRFQSSTPLKASRATSDQRGAMATAAVGASSMM